VNLIPFTADSAADALAQIRARLGPDAVVLNVRRLPAGGISRLWSRPKIEVLACVPPKDTVPETAAAPAPAAPLLDCLDAPVLPPAALRPQFEASRFAMPGPRRGLGAGAALLESMGLSALHAARVVEDLQRGHGDAGPENLADELAQYRNYLTAKWREFRQPESGVHVFIGPPGSGKTTALCKWLTQKTLIEGASARVWRLDVPRASTAEALSVHAEILNVPVERAWNPGASWPEEFLFIDLPGCETGDAAGLDELKSLLSTMPGAAVSLVLNAAYDNTVLQAQLRAFSALPVTHLLFTHLDEEPRRGKLWNFVLGTNYSLSFLAAGQNIPGQFLRATPALLFPAAMRGS
jgi:flagellar biosynthesis protein FlhF